MTAKYRMPEVNLGDIVLWSYRPGGDPAPAFVTQVGQEAIGLVYFPPDSRVGTPRDGVRHVSDPAAARVESDAGVFDFTATHKRLLALADAPAPRPRS